jgi:hypothetical protein
MALKLWLSAGAFVALTTHLVFFLEKKITNCEESVICYFFNDKGPVMQIPAKWQNSQR